MKQLIIVTFLFAFFSSNTFAQKLTIEKVQNITLRSSGSIKESTGDVKGYYFFYITDKVDKTSNEYELSITDENLIGLKKIKFVDSKDIRVLECSFNGTDLIFLFYNSELKTTEYQVFGADGKKKFTYSKEISKKDEYFLNTIYLKNEDAERPYKGLYAIEGKGFISNLPTTEEKRFTFEINFFGTEKKKNWVHIYASDYKITTAQYLGTFNNVVYLQIFKYKGLSDKNPDCFLVGLSSENGKLLFEKSTDLNKFKLLPITLSPINNGKLYLYGEYFNPKDNILKDKSQGFAFWEIGQNGEVKTEKYLTWQESIGKYLSVNTSGKIDDFGYMFIHTIIQTDNGDFYVVAEGYKEGSVKLAIRITDLLLIKFNSKFEIEELKSYKKNENFVILPDGMGSNGLRILGHYVKFVIDGFDYRYSQTSKDLSMFTLCYTDSERAKNNKDATFSSITYNNGSITTDKIKIKSDATWSEVLPAKIGQVLIIDYYKKAKKLEMHIEKLN